MRGLAELRWPRTHYEMAGKLDPNLEMSWPADSPT